MKIPNPLFIIVCVIVMVPTFWFWATIAPVLTEPREWPRH